MNYSVWHKAAGAATTRDTNGTSFSTPRERGKQTIRWMKLWVTACVVCLRVSSDVLSSSIDVAEDFRQHEERCYHGLMKPPTIYCLTFKTPHIVVFAPYQHTYLWAFWAQFWLHFRCKRSLCSTADAYSYQHIVTCTFLSHCNLEKLEMHADALLVNWHSNLIKSLNLHECT